MALSDKTDMQCARFRFQSFTQNRAYFFAIDQWRVLVLLWLIFTFELGHLLPFLSNTVRLLLTMLATHTATAEGRGWLPYYQLHGRAFLKWRK